MPWGVAAAAVIGAAGTAYGASASKSAANKQSGAASAAGQLSQSQYETTRDDLQPQRTAGNLALLQLQRGLGLSGAPGSSQDHSRANFNAQAYLAANPDAQQWVNLRAAQGLSEDPYDHYVADGSRRNDPSYFYDQTGANVQGSGQGTSDHGRTNFNSAAYLAANPDAQTWLDTQHANGLGATTAYDHYVADGSRRNDPSYFYDKPAASTTGTTGASDTSGGGVGYGSLLRNFTMDDFHQDPGYQFVQQQGEKSINRNALAAGRYNTGATLKSLDSFNSGLADQQYGAAYARFNQNQSKQFNELSGLAGTGQTATQFTDAAGQTAAAQTGNALVGAANANASGIVGSANAINNGLSQGLNYYQNQQLVNSLRTRPISTAGAGAGSGGTYYDNYGGSAANSWYD